MKIAIMLLNQGRGSGEVARQHARHLVDRGHRVFLLYPGIGDGVPGAENVDVPLPGGQMPVHEYLPAAGESQQVVARMGEAEAASYLPAYEQALESVIGEADIVIGHHANLSAIATRNVARRHGKPYTLFLHGTGIEPRHHGGFADSVWNGIREAIEQSAGLLVTTKYVRDSLVLPIVDLHPDRFLVLPCGVDLKAFHPANVDGIREEYSLPETYVLCPGALTESKGPQNVVAASELYDAHAATVFIGDGPLKDELERQLGNRGRFLGFVPDEHKTRLVNAATLLTAAPEKLEHFGIIYAEALAGGTPPVAYGGGGVPSVVTPEVGILTDRTPEALGEAVAGLLSEPGRIRRMARAGRARAERRYDYNRIIDRLESWLSGFVKRN